MPTRTLVIPATLDMKATVRTAKNPLMVGPTEMWWSTRTPAGTATLSLERTSDEQVSAEAWGDGADWMLDQAPALLGGSDDLSGFQPVGEVAKLWRNKPFRLGRTDRPWDSIVAGVFGQKVQVENAVKSRRLLARHFGDPAPGPRQGWILPGPDVVAQMAYHDFHRLGVERKRAEILIRSGREIRRMPNLTEKTPAQVQARLQHIRGIGPWTSAMVTATSMGDADAVPVGDYHIPNTISWLLAKEPRATDERMLELLEPYAGHRWRVILLAKTSGGAPKYGPRLALKGDGLHMGR
ncbi:MAG: 3-methyladenine DNA glycosylase/8-oxoguanine DNA glycosylase [Acidimicrobiales bacterium]|jgi:3-methyladenine DNA glycosylase/8-oxoguanine DNA glycosylase